MTVSASLNTRYPQAVIALLAGFSESDRSVLARWLAESRIGVNYALQILQQLQDVSKKTGSSPGAWLQDFLRAPEIETMSHKQLGKALRDELKRQLQPRLVAHEAKFAALVEELNLPSRTRLQPPQNFEGDLYRLEISFKTCDELEQKLEVLSQALQKKAWRSLDEFE